MRISDWSSDVCSSDLDDHRLRPRLLDLPAQDKAHYERSRTEAVAECEEPDQTGNQHHPDVERRLAVGIGANHREDEDGWPQEGPWDQRDHREDLKAGPSNKKEH